TLFCQQICQDGYGLLNFCGIKWNFDTQPHLLLFELIEHLGVRRGLQAFVLDVADQGLFFDGEDDNFPGLALFNRHAQIIEEALSPDSLEVSTQNSGIKPGILLRHDVKLHRILRHPAGSADLNVFDDFFGLSLGMQKRKEWKSNQRQGAAQSKGATLFQHSFLHKEFPPERTKARYRKSLKAGRCKNWETICIRERFR